MHSMYMYETLRHGREEMLRQAARERLIRQVAYKRWWQKLFQPVWQRGQRELGIARARRMSQQMKGV